MKNYVMKVILWLQHTWSSHSVASTKERQSLLEVKGSGLFWSHLRWSALEGFYTVNNPYKALKLTKKRKIYFLYKYKTISSLDLLVHLSKPELFLLSPPMLKNEALHRLSAAI